ncbi:MAG TPA: hypothetical protein VFZ53_33375 [Polyangiaceae bacterium]
MRFLRKAVVASSAGLSALWAAPAFGQQPGTDLSSGGLAPPPAVESQTAAEKPQPAATGTEQDLSRAEREDSGRGLEFVWLAGEVGVGHFGLEAFKKGDLVVETDERTQTGLVAGAGLGVRLIYFTLGARFRYAPLPDWALWTLGAEGGVHVPLGALEPYFTLGVGYVSIASKEGELTMNGIDTRLGAGVDYYFTNMFSVGANLTGDLMFLSRGEVADAPSGSVYAEDGSGIGGGLTLTAVMGLHF